MFYFAVSTEERGELFSSSANRIGNKQETERHNEVTADTSGRQWRGRGNNDWYAYDMAFITL